MARIVLSTLGSLGDLHPMIALAIELRRRGHTAVLNTWKGYREKVGDLGFEFAPLRPDIDPSNKKLTAKLMDSRTGPETLIREIVFPNLRNMFDDLTAACRGADLMVNGEVVFVAETVAETSGIKWISTSLAPLSMFSSHDPNVYPTAPWVERLRPMPVSMHELLFRFMRWTIRDWFEPFRQFRRDLGLNENIDPVFTDKFSPLLHLAMFSRAIAVPQPDWPNPTVQTGFCFYDESETAAPEDPRLAAFLESGEQPIVFTLGSAASMDPGSFFDESARAARKLGRRAVLLYGRDHEPPTGLSDHVIAFEFTPYSRVFPHAAAIVHQGGIGTTSQALRAGVPQILVPFSHDQPDNAVRCRRAGVAEIIDRENYTAETAAKMIGFVLSHPEYRASAAPLKMIIDAEDGTRAACDAIEQFLRK